MNKKLAADSETPVFTATQDDLARMYPAAEVEQGDWSELWQEDWMPPAGACGGGECSYSEGLWSLCGLHQREVLGCMNP